MISTHDSQPPQKSTGLCSAFHRRPGADHAPNPTFSLCHLNHLRALAPNSPNCVCYSRIRGGSPPDLLYEFHAGQHASHYGVLEFRSPLTACGITAAVDGVDGINQGDSNSLAAQSREPAPKSEIVSVGPSSPFPTRTKMRLKPLAAGIPTATSPDGAHPARPGRPRRTTPLPGRSVPHFSTNPRFISSGLTRQYAGLLACMNSDY